MAKAIASVRKLLKANDLDGENPAAQMIRQMLAKVTIYHNPAAPEGFQIKVDGKLDVFTHDVVCPSLVAEEGPLIATYHFDIM